MVALEDIKIARENIAQFVHRTPLFSSTLLNSLTGKELYFKAECLQKTGSFKPRGAANKITSLVGQDISGVITVSSGNHGQATAYVAGRLGIPAVIMVPEGAPAAKINAARSYGAEVIIGIDFTNPEEAAKKFFAVAEQRHLVPIHPLDDPLIIAGHGTIGLEILEDLPDVDVVIVPVGAGGLISGVATALKLSKPSVKVFGVGPQDACSMYKSFREKKVVTVHNMPETIADGIRASSVGELTLQHTLKYVDDVVTVSDAEIIDAMRLLWTRLKLVVEPSGATSFAAVNSGKVVIPDDSKVVCVLSGGNVDFGKIVKYLAA
jgi:threonine dehydratase